MQSDEVGSWYAIESEYGGVHVADGQRLTLDGILYSIIKASGLGQPTMLCMTQSAVTPVICMAGIGGHTSTFNQLVFADGIDEAPFTMSMDGTPFTLRLSGAIKGVAANILLGWEITGDDPERGETRLQMNDVSNIIIRSSGTPNGAVRAELDLRELSPRRDQGGRYDPFDNYHIRERDGWRVQLSVSLRG